MPGDDPNQRFNYLFEPLNGGDTIEDTDDEAVAKRAVGRPRLAGPARLTVAAIVLATAAATVAIVFLLMRSGPGGQVHMPVQVGPPATATSASPVATTEPAPPPTPTTETETPTVEPPTPVPTAAPSVASAVPEPSSQPSSAPVPEAPLTEPPATRPPISVQPAPRTPFPNQAPDYGSDQRGGLLGGGGLL